MRKIIIFIISIILPIAASAQAQINTKKVKISDFTQKITKVVLNGNDFFDITFQEEITAGWRISPYEFCTLEEFEQLKNNERTRKLVKLVQSLRRHLHNLVQAC